MFPDDGLLYSYSWGPLALWVTWWCQPLTSFGSLSFPPINDFKYNSYSFKNKAKQNSHFGGFHILRQIKILQETLRLEHEKFCLCHWGVFHRSWQKRKTIDCLDWAVELGCPVISLPRDLCSAGCLECSHRPEGALLPEICNLVWMT